MKNKSTKRNSKKRPFQNVRDTSKEALQKIGKEKLKTEAGQAYLYLLNKGPSTRQMISIGTGIPINHITRAAATIIDIWEVAHEVYKDYCQITGHKAHYIDIIKDTDNETGRTSKLLIESK